MNLFEVSLTNFCNFRCEYCISNKNRGSDKFSEAIKVDENGRLKVHPEGMTHEDYCAKQNTAHDRGDWLDLVFLSDFIRTKLNADWVISLTGGEPLLYPGIEEFIIELTRTNKVIISTNASLLKRYSKLFSIENDRLFFRIGFHPEQRNLEYFKEIIETIKTNNFKYIINYVIHPRYISSGSYKSHISYLVDNKFEHEVTPFEGTFEGVNYPRPEYVRTPFESFIFSTHQTRRLFNSPIGDRYIICEPNGDIFECSKKTKCLGNVYTGELAIQHFHKMECFYRNGCSTIKSANFYLKLFTNEVYCDR